MACEVFINMPRKKKECNKSNKKVSELLNNTHTKKTTMVSFRFPFSFSQPPRATTSFSGFSISAVAVSVTVGAAAAGAAIAASRNPSHPILEWAFSSHRSSLSPWGSITLADESVVEPKTGFSFPASIGDSRRLLGVGLRKKSLLGLKNIDVYAFGNFLIHFRNSC